MEQSDKYLHPYTYAPAYQKHVAYFCMEYAIAQSLKLIPTATPKLYAFERKMKLIRATYLKRLQHDSLALSPDLGLVL